jgi:hypothetical protein
MTIPHAPLRRPPRLALLLATLLWAAPAGAAEFKVIYLNYEPRHVAEGRAEPIVLEDGLLLSGPKELHPVKGCKPLKECRGTFEVPVLGEILDAMYRRNWDLVTVQPVTTGELKGGFLAFFRRRGLPPIPGP